MKTLASGFSSTAALLAAALGLGLAAPQRGLAAPAALAPDGPGLTLLSPAPRAALAGVRPVEVSAFYRGTPGNGIVSLELYIDGVRAQTKTLDAPEEKGIVSFLIDASLLRPGAHLVVVRATAVDAEVASVRGAFTYRDGGSDDAPADAALPPAPAEADGAAPVLRLLSPAPDSRVQGTVMIRAQASDAAGKPPYVSIFVDGKMEQLANYRPFEYAWDTTALSNGWHIITLVEAFDSDAEPVAHVKPIRVYVNNPGGATDIRHDLLDAAPAPRKALAARPLARRPQASGLPTAVARMARMARDNGRWDVLALPALPTLSDPFTSDKSAPATPRPVRPASARTAIPTTGYKPLATRRLMAAAAADRMLQMARAGLPDSGLQSPFLPLTPAPAAAPARALRPALPVFSLPSPRLHVLVPQLPLRAPGAARVHAGLGAASALQSVGQTRVQFNQSLLTLERPLAAQRGVLFGPLRRIFEAGGGTLQWTAQTGTVRAQTAAKDIRMTIGDRAATVNQQPFTLQSAPYLIGGRTMVPVSLLGTALDADVQFDAATGHLKITSRR